jgi:hypothetical protein
VRPVRLCTVLWLMTWMLVFPLFHVHPEGDHHHGEASHIHGGTIHTVFSQDLECEFQEIAHHSTCPEAEHQHLQASTHVGHALNHAELDFSLLSIPIERQLPKVGIVIAEVPSDGRTTTEQATVVASLQPDTPHNILFLSRILPLRAPPIQFL